MTAVRVIFFDVGGVLLSNGWDRHARRTAADEFGLDWDDFQERHDFVSSAFERGQMDLDTYLAHTVFHRERPFGSDAFTTFMRERSMPMTDSLALLGEISAQDRWLLATLNNESRELNDYRIRRFGLADHFSLFLSSCYLGVRKPEPAIYRMAVEITGVQADQCVFVDDRDLNLECAVAAGIESIHFTDAASLRLDLAALGVSW